MIISVNWLKKFTDIDLPIDKLVELIGARLVEVEDVIDLGAKYKDALIVKVIESERMADSDHLSVVKIDDGGVAENVERDGSGLVQVVCGAPNINIGQTVVWLPPGAIVPSSYGKADQFQLDARKLRGVTSSGMIASMRELDLGDEHDGILVLPDDQSAGASFAKVYELDDYLLDIENKSLTHRPDCFGIVGFAREVAAIQGKDFQTPDWLSQLEPDIASISEVTPPTVTIDEPELSDRYQAIVLAGAHDASSPLLIQTYLARVGMRPINAVVDVTNYLMLLTGQPLHAFDYDKLVEAGGGQADIHVRRGRSGERLELLDKRVVELDSDDIVIAAGGRPVALAGAMGGAATEIDNSTKNIIIESATFNLYNLRGTQMRHGVFSEAVTRFTKGQPAPLTAPTLAEATKLIVQWAGARPVTSPVEAYPGKIEPIVIELTQVQVNNVLGGYLETEQISQVLSRTGFDITAKDSSLDVTVPWWRADIHIAEDLIEEIGRLNGFDNITPTLPRREFRAVRPSNFEQYCRNLRQRLVRAGASEILSYSFVHGDHLRRAGQDPAQAFRIINALSPDLQYYRLSILPSLLDKVNMNLRQGFDKFALFEIGKVHRKDLTDPSEPELPMEVPELGLVLASKDGTTPTYFQTKEILEFVLLGQKPVYRRLENDDQTLFEPKRSAVVELNGQAVGVIGEFKANVRRNFKLPDYSAGFYLELTKLYDQASLVKLEYHPLSHYPSTDRDICFQVNKNISYGDLTDTLEAALEEIDLDTQSYPLDIYQPENQDVKNITVRIVFSSLNRTLTSQEVTEIADRIVNQVNQETGAKVI